MKANRICLKELSHGLCVLKSLATMFEIRRLQSMLIFFILSHPLFLYVLLLSLWCFSVLLNCYFQVSFYFEGNFEGGQNNST